MELDVAVEECFVELGEDGGNLLIEEGTGLSRKDQANSKGNRLELDEQPRGSGGVFHRHIAYGPNSPNTKIF